jgi:hypothetical protein
MHVTSYRISAQPAMAATLCCELGASGPAMPPKLQSTCLILCTNIGTTRAGLEFLDLVIGTHFILQPCASYADRIKTTPRKY